jgi:hypothetical protein
MTDMEDHGTKHRPQGNPVFVGSIVVLLLIGAGYLATELVQRHRFNRMKVEVEALIAGLQADGTFESRQDASIGIREGKGGPTLGVATGGSELRTSRNAIWFVSLLSGRSQRIVLSLNLVQERRWVLRSPFLLLDLSKKCRPEVYAEMNSRLRSRGLEYQSMPGF